MSLSNWRSLSYSGGWTPPPERAERVRRYVDDYARLRGGADAMLDDSTYLIDLIVDLLLLGELRQQAHEEAGTSDPLNACGMRDLLRFAEMHAVGELDGSYPLEGDHAEVVG